MDGEKTVLCEKCKVKIAYNVFENITSYNNIFIYFVNGDQYTIRIPEGCYAIRDLNQEIGKQMKENGHEVAIEIFTDLNTHHSILKIKANYAVQFSNRSKTFYKIRGFKEGIYTITAILIMK